MVEISTSLLSVKDDIVKKIYLLEVAHTDYFHIDVMDGKFVKNNTQEKMLDYASAIKQISNIPLEIHLMVENVKENIDDYISLEPNIITFQIEALKSEEEILEMIKYIKENNIRVGLAIKPNTSIEEIYKFLPYIHQILIMTVEPGEGGQELIPETILKVETLKKYVEKNNIEIDIEVDGGINSENSKKLQSVGVNILVVGTYIINSKDYKKTIIELKK